MGSSRSGQRPLFWPGNVREIENIIERAVMLARGEIVAPEDLPASVASTVGFPMQDVLGLGSEAQMNRPGTASGNWRWRLARSDLQPEVADRLRGLCELYGRAAPPGAEPPSRPRQR